MRRGVIFLTVLMAALVLVVPGSVFGQDKPPDQKADQANWILYERANAMAAQREFGQALQLYKEAISQGGRFPEAEVGIGDVYFEEGELDLARQQYEKAYNLRSAFNIADSKYDVLYKLGGLYESQEMFRLMEDSLAKIVTDDKKYGDPASAYLKAQVERNYLERGIDHTLLLYQISVPFAQQAHSKLGWFYYRTGRFTQAISHLLYSVVYVTKDIEDYLHDQDVEFGFSSLSDLMTMVDRDKRAASYVSGSSYFKDIYYLAGSSFAAGYPTHATLLWKLLAASRSSGQYAQLAARQLKAPWTERLLGADKSGTAQK